MLKNIRITHLLRHLFRSYTLTAIFLSLTLLSAAFGQDDVITDTLTEGTSSIWAKVQLYGGVILVIFLFSAFFYLLRLFQKDKLLKTLLNKYVVFQMKEENRRYRGTMRLEISGMEIISEESRQRGHAPSYIFKTKEREEQIVAYIRYHDTMNERELRERTWELERVYHPPFIYKMRRKIRNTFVALREASANAIRMVMQSVKSGIGGRFEDYNRVYQQTVDAKKGEGDITGIDRLDDSTAHLQEQETYERLIERLVGTRIKVRTETGEYTAILKDYNNKHIALMGVKDGDNNGYRDHWKYDHEFAHDMSKLNRRDDRGLRVRAEGNDEDGYSLVFENNTPYQIQLGHVRLFEDAPNWAHNFEFKYHINAFTVQKLLIHPVVGHKVGPFQRIAKPERLTIRNYKKIGLDFRSFRDADIIFPRKYCNIVESAERYQPELFTLSGLTDTILDMSDTEDIAIADKEGKPIHGINVVHGYVTNVNEERIDLKTIDTSYSRRWDVENAFRRFDNKFRRGFPIHKRLLPTNRAKITAHASIVEQIHSNAVRHEALAPVVYPARSLNTAEQRARRRKLIRNRIVGGINATFNTKFWKPNAGVPRTPGVTRSEIQMAMPIKLMAFTGNTSTVEFPVLQRFEYIQEHHMIYKEVPDLRTDRLPKTDILWIGNGEIYKSGYRLNIDAEHRIKNFVSQGGVAIVSGQDIKASAKQRRGTGWIPEPLTGIECDETYELFPTSRGKRSRIFQYPNPLNGNHHNTDPEAMEQPFIRFDDMWLDPLGKWTSLAKTNIAPTGLPSDRFENASALLLLPFQKGLYIVTSLKNETEADVRINDKIMENLLHFSVKWLDKQRSPRKLQRIRK